LLFLKKTGNLIKHPLEMARLVGIDPNFKLTFQFNSKDGQVIVQGKVGCITSAHKTGPGTILSWIRQYLGKEKVTIGPDGKEHKNKGKGWGDLYLQGLDGVWRPLGAVIPFRYRPKTIPVGGSNSGGAKASIKAKDFNLMYSKNEAFRNHVEAFREKYMSKHQ
jgi:hypothetical protein